MEIALPIKVINIANIINDAAFDVYLAGGATRDSIMKIIPNDYELITNALPHQIKRILDSKKIKYVKLSNIPGTFNIVDTTINIGSARNDNYHNIIFGCDLLTDSNRRDLTINSIYYDFKNSKIIDYHNGIDDINNKNINIIGDPYIKLASDPVKILRLIRFTCTSNFLIDEKLITLIKNIGILEVPPEIIYSELKKVFYFGRINFYLKLMVVLELFDDIFREFCCIIYDYETNIIVDSLSEFLAILFRYENYYTLEEKMIRSKYEPRLISNVLSLHKNINKY